jgi:hypothetical protein
MELRVTAPGWAAAAPIGMATPAAIPAALGDDPNRRERRLRRLFGASNWFMPRPATAPGRQGAPPGR